MAHRTDAQGTQGMTFERGLVDAVKTLNEEVETLSTILAAYKDCRELKRIEKQVSEAFQKASTSLEKCFLPLAEYTATECKRLEQLKGQVQLREDGSIQINLPLKLCFNSEPIQYTWKRQHFRTWTMKFGKEFHDMYVTVSVDDNIKRFNVVFYNEHDDNMGMSDNNNNTYTITPKDEYLNVTIPETIQIRRPIITQDPSQNDYFIKKEGNCILIPKDVYNPSRRR
jgi:hypothetical protein